MAELHEHIDAATAEIARCFDIASNRFTPPLVRVTWTARGRIAGKCHSTPDDDGKYRIEMNPQLARFDLQETIKTMAHEYAHACAFACYWRIVEAAPGASRARMYRGHGRGWASIMRSFGYEADRCHTMPFERARKTKGYVMACKCEHREKPIIIGEVRFKRIQLHQKRYRCGCCYAVLTWTGQEVIRV